MTKTLKPETKEREKIYATFSYFIINFIFFMMLPTGSYLFGLIVMGQKELWVPCLALTSIGLCWLIMILENRTEIFYENYKNWENWVKSK